MGPSAGSEMIGPISAQIRVCNHFACPSTENKSRFGLKCHRFVHYQVKCETGLDLDCGDLIGKKQREIKDDKDNKIHGER